MGEVVEFKRGANGSTGPRTAAGKRRSSLNALKLGAYASSVVVGGVEDPAEFNALLRDVIAYHQIDDPIALLAAERLVAIAWRLRRVRRVEARKLSGKAEDYTEGYTKLEALRQQLDRVQAWVEASVASRDAFVSATVVSSIVEAVQFIISEAGKKETFATKRIARIVNRGKRVRAETLMNALGEALDRSPIKFRGMEPGSIIDDEAEFLSLIETCMRAEEKTLRKEIEVAERGLMRTLTGSLELNWQDERSLSEAERRLDSQFSRAMRDFHEARRASIESGRPAKPSTANAR